MKSNVEKKLTEFFETHPEATVVFVALGVLFTDLEKANTFCGGTSDKPVTFTREQVELLDDAAAGAELDAWAKTDDAAQTAAEEAAAEETPAEETPADEVPADETPADDAPPVDDAPEKGKNKNKRK